MGPFSHYAIAARLAERLAPADLGQYLWGAVAPDVRYLAGLPRAATHVEQAAIDGWLACAPQLADFLLGYRVHCLLDEIDLTWEVGALFPFNLLRLARRSLPHAQATMLFEMAVIDRISAPPMPDLPAGAHNPLLADLGVSAEHSAAFAGALRDFTRAPSAGAALEVFQRLGILKNVRAKGYLRAAETFHQRPLAAWLLLRAVRAERLVSRHAGHVYSQLGRTA